MNEEKQLNLRITPSQKEKLKKISELTGKTQKEIILEGLDILYMESQQIKSQENQNNITERVIIPINNMEIIICNELLQRYRKRMTELQKEIEFLQTKKFKFGEIILNFNKNDENCLIFGKIVGWDFHYKYYRVYYNKQAGFVGAREESFVKYNSNTIKTPVPKEILELNPLEYLKDWSSNKKKNDVLYDK